jgi:hypothetical protein
MDAHTARVQPRLAPTGAPLPSRTFSTTSAPHCTIVMCCTALLEQLPDTRHMPSTDVDALAPTSTNAVKTRRRAMYPGKSEHKETGWRLGRTLAALAVVHAADTYILDGVADTLMEDHFVSGRGVASRRNAEARGDASRLSCSAGHGRALPAHDGAPQRRRGGVC